MFRIDMYFIHMAGSVFEEKVNRITTDTVTVPQILYIVDDRLNLDHRPCLPRLDH